MNLIGYRKFILAILCLVLSFIALMFGKLNGTQWDGALFITTGMNTAAFGMKFFNKNTEKKLTVSNK